MISGITAVLLSAGESSRFWPLATTKHKCMYEVAGKPIIYHTLTAIKNSGISDVTVVVSPNDNSIRNYLGNGGVVGMNIEYTIQEKPLGMGNAIMTTREILDCEYFFVFNADQVNADELIKPMLEALGTGYELVLSTQQTSTPWNYGILELEGRTVRRIIEKPPKGTEPSNQMVIGAYLLPRKFFRTLSEVPVSQYSYESAIQQFIDKNGKVGAVPFQNLPEITLKFPWHLFEVNKYIMDRYIERKISEEAKISPSAIIEGKVVIEKGVRVFENAVIKGPCYINEGAIVGNGSLVRDYSYIGRKAIVGYGTEIKHSIIYDRSETHMNYVGDSIVDEDCGFGAGTITANRRLDRGNITTVVKGERVDTGFTFFGNVIGRNVHTGILAGFMPGVKVGSNCNIGAGTMVMKDLPDNSLCFSGRENIIKNRTS